MVLSRIYFEVAQWAGRKRDGRIVVPWTVSPLKEGEWRDGYYTAMNEVAQHFNMERVKAEREKENETKQV